MGSREIGGNLGRSEASQKMENPNLFHVHAQNVTPTHTSEFRLNNARDFGRNRVRIQPPSLLAK